MGLTFCNNYPYARQVSIAIGYYDPSNCATQGLWIKRGWWNLAPGQCVYVYAGSLRNVNRYWVYYARATNGAIWNGPYCTQVTNQAFHQCWNNPSQYQICYRLLDINSYDNFTLTLVP